MSKPDDNTIDVTPASTTGKPRALAPLPKPANLSMFERLAKDGDVDVEKLGKLIELQKDVLKVQSRAAFEAAFAAMQAELPVITKRGVITNKDRTPRSTFARLDDIQKAVLPVLSQHGFSLRHRTEWPEERKNIIRIVGILSHVAGHYETSVFEAPADKSEFRTDIQSQGSTVTYGRRYTTIDLLNLTLQNMDDDGQKGKVGPADERPAAVHAHTDTPITEPQRKRLYAITKRSGRTPAEVSTWLAAKYGYKTSEEITRRDYDAICKHIEAKDPLPLPAQEPAVE